MKVVAALAVLLAVTAVAGASPAPAPVLGFTWSGSQLAWFDPATLRQVSRKAAPVARHTCAWEFGAGGARLAASLCGGTDSLDIRFVDTRALRPLGDVPLGTTGWVNGLAWLRPDRVVAVVDRDEGGAIVFVIDPQSRRVVRRVALDRDAWWFTRLPNAVALLLVPTGRIGAVQAAVVDAAGEIRRTTLGRVTGGLIVDESGDEPAMTQRGPAFAVDTGTGTAYAVDPSLVVAEVDLATLAVAYHTAGAARALQKSIDGPQRSARWLGDGTLAITTRAASTRRGSR